MPAVNLLMLELCSQRKQVCLKDKEEALSEDMQLTHSEPEAQRTLR